MKTFGATQSKTGTLSGVNAPMPPFRRSRKCGRQPLNRDIVCPIAAQK